MRITIAEVTRLTLRALDDNSVNATIDAVSWLGVRARDRQGPLSSRTARVWLKSTDGRRVRKLATLWSDGSFMIR